MRIDQIKVGGRYRQRYGTEPVTVHEIITRQQIQGYSWNRRTVNQRRLRVTVGGHEYMLKAADLEEPWEAYEERQRALATALAERRQREDMVRVYLVQLGVLDAAIDDVSINEHGIANVRLTESFVAQLTEGVTQG